MDLFEYQARDMFEKHGVPVLAGIVAHTPEEAKAAAEKIGGVDVVKAQVKAGGRGKAGGVKLAKTADEAYEHAAKHPRHGHQGPHRQPRADRPGRATSPRSTTSPSCSTAPTAPTCPSLASRAAWRSRRSPRPPRRPRQDRDRPGRRASTRPRPTRSSPRQASPRSCVDKVADVILKLWDVFKEEDATLVEVNPLVLTGAGDIVALDGKVSLDENADFRHADHAHLEDKDAADPLEAKAKEKDLNYVKLDGEVGIIGNGAGLVMSTLDVVAYAGENHGGVKPANFLDIGGGANAEVMAAGLDVILDDPQVKSVFVNVFGGITACDEVANGIVGALASSGDEANKPLVVRLDGNNVEEGRRILDEANHPLVTLADTMDGAADKAAELANAAK